MTLDPIHAGPARAGQEDRTLPVLGYGLYLFGFFTVLLTLVLGLALAYANRGSAGPTTRTHYDFMIRTFWLSFAWFAIGGVLFVWGWILAIVLVGIPLIFVGGAIMGLVGVWFLVRSGLGLFYALKGEPYPRPQTWLF